MELALLEQMVGLMSINDLNTIDVRDGDKRIILKRGVMPTVIQQPMHPAVMQAVPAGAPSIAPGSATPDADDTAGLTPIKSPMVGTFYSAATPEAKPFISVGSSITEDSDVCIIEAMKVFNNIKAETHGTVAKVLVTNGQTVEFGQTLFLVKP